MQDRDENRNQNSSFVLTSFMLVLGILLGAFIGLIFMVRMIFIDTSDELSIEDTAVQEAIESRIAPAGSVLLMGSDELEAAAVQQVAVALPPDAPLTGPQVYNQACFACHEPPDGVGGAPVIGAASAWEDRVAQGMDTLIDHAINGYQGEDGFMPAKGGQVNLSDEEVIAAVEYMLEQLPE